MARVPPGGPQVRVDPVARTVELAHALPADVDAVWRALTTPHGTAAWLGRLEGAPLRAGSRFSVWHDGVVRSDHVVLQWEPGGLLAVTWDFPGERASQVLVALEDRGDAGTLLTLSHADLDDPPAYAAGWHRHLEHLEAHLRGADLPLEQFWDGYDDLLERYRTAT